jgi:hypothetical protein
MNNSISIEQIGFPGFQTRAFEKYQRALDCTHKLRMLANEALAKPAADDLHYVLLHILAVGFDSLGALQLLALNGYGADALKIARSIFEADVTAKCLEADPGQLKDFLDFHYVATKRWFDYLGRTNPTLTQSIPDNRRQEIDSDFKRVAPRFTGKKGRIRNSWSKKYISEMAKDAGLAEQYDSLYSLASTITHVSVSGIHALTEESGRLATAPSESVVRDALISGHRAALSLLTTLNNVGRLGPDEQLKSADQDFVKVWVSLEPDTPLEYSPDTGSALSAG